MQVCKGQNIALRLQIDDLYDFREGPGTPDRVKTENCFYVWRLSPAIKVYSIKSAGLSLFWIYFQLYFEWTHVGSSSARQET